MPNEWLVLERQVPSPRAPLGSWEMTFLSSCFIKEVKDINIPEIQRLPCFPSSHVGSA